MASMSQCNDGGGPTSCSGSSAATLSLASWSLGCMARRTADGVDVTGPNIQGRPGGPSGPNHTNLAGRSLRWAF
jgi:hypothetical protein